MSDADTKPATGLLALADQAQRDLTDAAPAPGETGPDGTAAKAVSEELAQQMAMLQAATGSIIFGLLKAGRARIIKDLPEFEQECPEDLLQAPAGAAVELLKGYTAKAAAFMGGGSRFAMLAVSLLPIGMAYMTAREKHAAADKLDGHTE